jgi:hypothetical protein
MSYHLEIDLDHLANNNWAKQYNFANHVAAHFQVDSIGTHIPPISFLELEQVIPDNPFLVR